MGDPGRAHEDYATLAAGVQIASLFLWQQGIASKWSTGGFSTHAETYRILGLNPAEVRFAGCLVVGMAAVVPAAPERPSQDQFLRRVE